MQIVWPIGPQYEQTSAFDSQLYTLLPYQGSLLPVSIWVANINILTTAMIGYDAILKLTYDCTYRNRPRDLSVGPKVDTVDKSTLNLTICCWSCCIQADPEKISPNFVCTYIVRPHASEQISCTHSRTLD